MALRHPLAYEGEFGWLFRIDSDYDGSGATATVFRFTGPDGTTYDKTATAVTTLAAGDLQWTVTSGFFTKGQWTVRTIWTHSTTKLVKGKLFRFTIGEAEVTPS
jgi:hypothetical protein